MSLALGGAIDRRSTCIFQGTGSNKLSRAYKAGDKIWGHSQEGGLLSPARVRGGTQRANA